MEEERGGTVPFGPSSITTLEISNLPSSYPYSALGKRRSDHKMVVFGGSLFLRHSFAKRHINKALFFFRAPDIRSTHPHSLNVYARNREKSC